VSSSATDTLDFHRTLAQRLCRADAWFEPVKGFELIETHISTLVLAGPYALKLKKPVALDFVDFSTLAQRKHFCEEELRINRRTAPTLYLRVLPVTGSLDAPRLEGAGKPIEWALLMRRFDNALLLDRLAKVGRLTPAQIDVLAQRVAALHELASPSPSPLGDAAITLRWATDNLHAVAAHPLAAAARDRMTGLERWTRQRHAMLAGLMTERQARGRVREGHGDLHLGNIVLLDGAPVPFDAIEFNPELRHIDVLSDIAFTFMDLLAHRLPALAWRLLNGYLEATGDYAGAPLLRWFAAYRALVRAKVALLRAAQDVGAADPSAFAAFRDHLALAEALAAPPPPMLVLTTGLSGSGKTTVARTLVESVGGVSVRSDVERKRLFGLAATDRPADTEQFYGTQATARTYARLAELARSLIDGGIPAIVDAAFLRRSERDALRELAQRLGLRCIVVECTAPEPVLRKRLAHRSAQGADASDATVAVLDLQLRVREPLTDDECAHAVRVETDVAPADLAARCAELARAWLALSTD
jgi:aminoglycoside phosphotransferase family enzyme/predicted kinase